MGAGARSRTSPGRQFGYFKESNSKGEVVLVMEMTARPYTMLQDTQPQVRQDYVRLSGHQTLVYRPWHQAGEKEHPRPSEI